MRFSRRDQPSLADMHSEESVNASKTHPPTDIFSEETVATQVEVSKTGCLSAIC